MHLKTVWLILRSLNNQLSTQFLKTLLRLQFLRKLLLVTALLRSASTSLLQRQFRTLLRHQSSSLSSQQSASLMLSSHRSTTPFQVITPTSMLRRILPTTTKSTPSLRDLGKRTESLKSLSAIEALTTMMSGMIFQLCTMLFGARQPGSTV